MVVVSLNVIDDQMSCAIEGNVTTQSTTQENGVDMLDEGVTVVCKEDVELAELTIAFC